MFQNLQRFAILDTVSALCILSELKGFTYRVPKQVNKVLFSGESMPVRHLNIWRQYLPDAMYVNLYGPTEITCNCTYFVVDREFEPGEAQIPGSVNHFHKIRI